MAVLKMPSIIFLLACSFLVKNVLSKEMECIPRANLKMASKCKYGNGRSACVPRVVGTVIHWEDVTPTTFTARWNRTRNAFCYKVEVLEEGTSFEYKTVQCWKYTHYEVSGLMPWTPYSIRISAVDRNCDIGRPSAKIWIKTLWAPLTTTTSTAVPKGTPKAKQCGNKFFTCESNEKECIPIEKWCDRTLHCRDGSDERGCPGGCKELDIEFNDGNYSCSRWGSPGSVCTFDCNAPYRRDGSPYTQCHRRRRKWTQPVPVCRLSYTRILRLINDASTDESLTVQWEPVSGARKYSFRAVESSLYGVDSDPLVRIQAVNVSECCRTEITQLKPDTEFEITMNAVDDEGVDGMESLPVFGRTVTTLDMMSKKSGLRKKIH